jgi:anti-anti-sigma factor
MTAADGLPTTFGVATSTIDGATVVTVRGDIDIASAPKLKVLLDGAIRGRATSLVLDLAGRGDIDSSGLAVVARAARQLAERGGQLSLQSPSAPVRRLLEVTGINELTGTGAAGSRQADPAGHPSAKARGTPDDLVAAVLQMVVRLARALIGGADGVSVSLRRHGHLSTVAASDQTIMDMDACQYATGEGPCIDASVTGERFHTASLASETRWPTFTPQAQALGINAILSSPLHAGAHPVGALNIYARTVGAFTPDDRTVASVFATEASRSLGDAENAGEWWSAGIDEALRSRAIIAQAQGVLMERIGVDQKTAYTLLRRHASESGHPLLERADEIVASSRRADPGSAGGHHG